MPEYSLTLTIAVPSPLRRSFDYLPNAGSKASDFAPGMRVAVPFGRQKSIVGIIITVNVTPPESKHRLRPIHQCLDDTPSLSEDVLALCHWCSQYYHYPLGEVCQLALPSLLRKATPPPQAKTLTYWRLAEAAQNETLPTLARAKKQLAAVKQFQALSYIHEQQLKSLDISRPTINALINKDIIEVCPPPENTVLQSQHVRTTSNSTLLAEQALPLNEEQQHVLSAITLDTFNSYLLEGVTGSGKTEVYLQAIEKVIAAGKQVLVLVPEIGLTPQTVERFKRRFHVTISTLHSGMSDKQRFEQWQAAQKTDTSIIIGTRSSVFTPIPALGLIVVDEEHDLSYKQQEGVRYSARDTAIVRAHKINIPIILGSATPSLETLQNALSGRFQHLHLRKRATNATMPNIHCIEGQGDQLSQQSIQAIRHTLEQGQQALVFINRRGYAPTLICQDCGWISQCQNCDCRMTLHRKTNHSHLHCHHCDHQSPTPRACPDCHSQRLQPLGQGTQRSEEELNCLFSAATIIRIDRDSIRRKGELEQALERVNTNEPCILVGTQMLAKGHHFTKVSLVIILGMDNGFFSSDFRGSERMGQLLTQVAGRAGRENHQGQVLIQTQFPEHPLLQQLIHEGYGSLARQILSERQLSHMPPYEHLAFIRCHAPMAATAIQFLQDIYQHIINRGTNATLQTIGPLPATIERRNNRFYYYLQIKGKSRTALHQLLASLCEQLERQNIPRGLHWLIDVDPQES